MTDGMQTRVYMGQGSIAVSLSMSFLSPVFRLVLEPVSVTLYETQEPHRWN